MNVLQVNIYLARIHVTYIIPTFINKRLLCILLTRYFNIIFASVYSKKEITFFSFRTVQIHISAVNLLDRY